VVNNRITNCNGRGYIYSDIRMKKTAVEWLQEALSLTFEQQMQFEGLFQQAKEMEKQQQERSYSDMQEYTTFCIECDRKEMPLLLVKDWYEHYKK